MSKQNSQISKKQRREQRQLEEQKAGAFEFMQKINGILAKIRVSDSGMMETKENTDPNKQVITRVLFPPEGGVITYFDKLEHPCKGFCYGETVETVDEVKKTLMSFLTGFFESMTKNKIKTIIFALLFRKQFEIIAKRLVIQVDYRMRRVLQKPERYCICSREFHRVFNQMINWYPEHKDAIQSLRNIWCMALEYDDAYRYTLQDVLVEFNKDNARKDLVKELKKMIDVILERDDRGLSVKFSKIRKLLFLLNYSKRIKQMVERFFLEINLDIIKMDEDDKFHACFKEDYNWKHESNFKQTQQKKKEEKEKSILAQNDVVNKILKHE